MHARYIPLLKCPKTGAHLTLNAWDVRPNGFVVTGSLTSSGGMSYPIIRGIPRFVDRESYSKSWGFEWNFWPRVQFECHLKGTPMEGVTRDKVERIVLLTQADFSGKTIMEVGCGPGHFMDIMLQENTRLIGLDMSMAVEACRKNFPENPNVLVVQADLTCTPIRDEVLDGAVGIGVFHHIPRPEEGIREVARTVRAGGFVAVAVYTHSGDYARPSVKWHRWVFKRLMPIFGNWPPLIAAFISAYVLYYAHIFLYKIWLGFVAEFLQKYVWVVTEFPNADFRACDNFDMMTPIDASTHTPGDVSTWLRASGCSTVKDSRWNASAKVGIKDCRAEATTLPRA